MTVKPGEVIDIGIARRTKAGRAHVVTVDAGSLRFRYAGDGLVEVTADVLLGGRWTSFGWTLSAGAAQATIERGRRAETSSARSTDLAPEASPGPRRARCGLTPEGYLSHRRTGRGCTRWRGHADDHRNGQGEMYMMPCPHFGMFQLDGRPSAPTCPWCQAELAPLDRTAEPHVLPQR